MIWHPPSLPMLVVALVAVLGTGAIGASAQDIEAAGEVHGVEPPDAYFEKIREDPNFFELERGWSQRPKLASFDEQPLSGELPILVVQFLFADSPEPDIAPAEIQRTLFDGPSEYGTLSDYYDEVSGGELTVDGTVTPWIRTSMTMEQAVGNNHGLGARSQIGEVLKEALEAADTLVDWERYNNDGPDGVPNSGDDDGYVDAVAFQFIEVAASCGGPAVWPHRSTITNRTGEPFETSGRTPDGEPILVDDYIIQSTVTCEGELQRPTTSAHEVGHVLGLPDLYDRSEGSEPGERRWVVGCWSLMAAGSWGCGDPTAPPSAKRPPHMGAWEKVELGWAPVKDVGAVEDEEFVLDPVRQGGSILRIPLTPSEHYLVEYREQEGFDADLPVGGVLI